MTDICTPQQPEPPKPTGYTWELVKLLEEAIVSGELLVRANGRTYQYQSTSQMIRAKDNAIATLNRQEADKQSQCRRRGMAFRGVLRNE